MKPRYKLKSWVVVCVYLLSIGAIISSCVLIGKALNSSVIEGDNLSYVYRGLFEESVPVVSANNSVIKPYDSDNVKIIKEYYDKEADSDKQERSLIFYQNTYMPNTGVLYGSNESFDIKSVLDGTVENIVADEIMGNIVTIKHSNALTTSYSCLNEVKVLIGDTIKQGDIIGTSGVNKVESSSENMLLFEVISNGEYINPETFYTMDVNELS